MQFVPEMTVAEALALHPHARWVLAAWQLRGCVDCSAREAETLGEVAAGYRLPLERLLADLNGLVAESRGRG
jgi:hybrid cluster-associated redox disulfide protein